MKFTHHSVYHQLPSAIIKKKCSEKKNSDNKASFKQTLTSVQELLKSKTCESWGHKGEKYRPVMVPCTMVPFLSSIETVSLFSFIKNLLISNIRLQKICIIEEEKALDC